MTVIFALLMLVGFLTADAIVNHLRTKKVSQAVQHGVQTIVQAFREIPSGVELALNHTWQKVGAGNVVTVGIDEFISRFVGSLDAIMLPEPGSIGGNILLRDGDRTLAVACPVNGRVVAVNQAIMNNASFATNDPYGSGWLLKIEAEPGQRRQVLGGGQAGAWLREQAMAAREFFLGHTGPQSFALMQDGGPLADGVLKMYEAGTWSDFNEQFLTLPNKSVAASAEAQ